MDEIPGGEGEREPPLPPQAVGAGFADRRLKILICDDERHVARRTQVGLERQGHEVLVAYDGVEGLRKVRFEMPDLCVLDAMMPRMDGFELIKEIRQDPATAHLPVIMLTAKTQDRDVFARYDYGADLYLTKPVNPMDLVALLGGLTAVRRLRP